MGESVERNGGEDKVMEFGKKITTTDNGDGSVTIREEGYYNGLNSVVEQTRVDITISRDTILTELIRCLDLVKTSTPDIIIRISKDKNGEPLLLQKTWEIRREKLK